MNRRSFVQSILAIAGLATLTKSTPETRNTLESNVNAKEQAFSTKD